jgi:hypothetical protein
VAIKERYALRAGDGSRWPKGKPLIAYGNVATGYAGTLHFTSSDPQAILPLDYTFTAADQGTHTFAVTLKTAGTQTVTAADSANAAIQSHGSLQVNPGAVTQFSLTASATLGAYDPYGNLVWSVPNVASYTVTSSGDVAVMDQSGTFDYCTAAGTAWSVGANSAYAVTPGGNILLDHGGTLLYYTPGGTQQWNVPNVASFAVAPNGDVLVMQPTGSAGTSVAGSQLGFTIAAYTPQGNLDAAFLDTLHFSSSDPLAVLPADYAFAPADGGTHAFAVTLRTAGTQTVSVSDTANSSTSLSTSLQVVPAAASSLVLSGLPAAQTAGAAAAFTVTARDAYGNVATGYTGPVHFSSTDKQPVLPANYSFTAADQGRHTFSVTFKTAGTQSVTATDSANAAITGPTSLQISPADASRFALSAPSTPEAAAPASVTLTAYDPYNNVATGYTGTIHLTSTDAKAVLPANYTFTAADGGVHVFSATLETAANQTITAADTVNTALKSQASVKVSPAALSQFKVSAPASATAGTAVSVTVTAQDAYGNTVTGYLGSVHFTSSDSKAVLPADYTFTATDQGKHTFSVTLKTAGRT